VRAGQLTCGLARGGLIGATAAGAATPGGDLAGRWATPSGGVVEFAACRQPDREASTCGRIAALGGAAEGQRLDVRNSLAPLRARPVLGLEILSGVRPAGAGAWTVAALYSPDDGRTYRGAIHLVGDDRLELKGCALAILCQTQTWRRVR
jgi:uncharacterized protein (DUF2147 family)